MKIEVIHSFFIKSVLLSSKISHIKLNNFSNFHSTRRTIKFLVACFTEKVIFLKLSVHSLFKNKKYEQHCISIHLTVKHNRKKVFNKEKKRNYKQIINGYIFYIQNHHSNSFEISKNVYIRLRKKKYFFIVSI